MIKKIDLVHLSFCLVLFSVLIHYFFTGLGGSTRLAVRLVPVAVSIYFLNEYRAGKLYPKLGRTWNKIILTLIIVLSISALFYLEIEFEDLTIVRFGDYNVLDLVFGSIIFGLVTEISRRAHFVLFAVNAFLIGYCILGPYVPVSVFWHPGISIYRVITSSSVEFATGVYGFLTQLALTYIAAFILFMSVMIGFGVQASIIKYLRSIFGKSPKMLPQTAVWSSMSVGMASGSAASNVAVTGSLTIPMLKKVGFPAVYSGAIETASSMGGLLMPPMMALAGFIMAGYLGVSYWEVVIRGFGIAFIYYLSVAFAVYLLSFRYRLSLVERGIVSIYDKLYTLLFFGSLAFLIYLMGIAGVGTMLAGLYTGIFMFIAFFAIFTLNWFFEMRGSEISEQKEGYFKKLSSSLKEMVTTYGNVTSDLTLLLAILGIMVGFLTITGFLVKWGWIMMGAVGMNIIAMIIIAFLFGWIVGLGVSPSATYLITVIAISPPLIAAGVNPWVIHFFAFLIGVWSELSPPTSVSAAVASSISGASFMSTMMSALKICAPLLILTFAIFVRPEIVISPDLSMLYAFVLLLIGCLGLCFALFGKFSKIPMVDWGLRGLLGVLSSVLLFVPGTTLIAPIIVSILFLGIYYRSKIIE